MASGRLGAVKPAAATNTTLYKPAAAVIAVVSVSVCNQSTGTQENIRIAVVQSASTNPAPATTEYVAYGSVVTVSGDTDLKDRAMFGPYELNGSNNDQIVVYSTGGNCSFVCTGDEGAV